MSNYTGQQEWKINLCHYFVLQYNISFYNRIAPKGLGNKTSEARHMGWDWSMGSLEVAQYEGIQMEWPLEARKSLRRSPRALTPYPCCLLANHVQTLNAGSLFPTVDDLLQLHGLHNQRSKKGCSIL